MYFDFLLFSSFYLHTNLLRYQLLTGCQNITRKLKFLPPGRLFAPRLGYSVPQPFRVRSVWPPPRWHLCRPTRRAVCQFTNLSHFFFRYCQGVERRPCALFNLLFLFLNRCHVLMLQSLCTFMGFSGCSERDRLFNGSQTLNRRRRSWCAWCVRNVSDVMSSVQVLLFSTFWQVWEIGNVTQFYHLVWFCIKWRP